MNAAQDNAGICSSFAEKGYSVKLRGFSAVDLYMGLPSLPFLWTETNADIAVLARAVENLRFPGVEVADAAADTAEGTCYFRCLDRDEPKENNPSFPLLSFGYDWHTRRFEDPLGVYPLLRKLRGGGTVLPDRARGKKSRGDENAETGEEIISWESGFNPGAGRYRAIMDAALILARYAPDGGTLRLISGELARVLRNGPPEVPPGPETGRVFLSCLLVSKQPGLGLEFLKQSGFLGELWPELACYDDVDHSKEFHPEGNVWNHTLETFRHRKPLSGGAFDLRLSLGLLLHDAGKPAAASSGSRRFDGHAELGARVAARFLERLEFDPALISDIFYLVRNHMLPAALKRLPLTKTAGIMASPLFPVLMELYRCDESSSFKGLDGYYENSAAYQAYLKNLKNPYRSADGKKMGRKEIIQKAARPGAR